MGVLTWKGATAKEALGSETVALVPEWAEKQGFADNPVAVAGRDAVRRVGLPELPHLPRHRQQQPRRARPLGGGREGHGASSGRSTTSRTRASKTPGSPMPSFAALGDENLTKIATFLEARRAEVRTAPAGSGRRRRRASHAASARRLRSSHARLPRSHRRLGRALRRAPPAVARGRRLRDRPRRLGGRRRGDRDRALRRRRACRATRCSTASSATRATR